MAPSLTQRAGELEQMLQQLAPPLSASTPAVPMESDSSAVSVTPASAASAAGNRSALAEFNALPWDTVTGEKTAGLVHHRGGGSVCCVLDPVCGSLRKLDRHG
jgi:hypothetical protein